MNEPELNLPQSNESDKVSPDHIEDISVVEDGDETEVDVIYCESNCENKEHDATDSQTRDESNYCKTVALREPSDVFKSEDRTEQGEQLGSETDENMDAVIATTLKF